MSGAEIAGVACISDRACMQVTWQLLAWLFVLLQFVGLAIGYAIGRQAEKLGRARGLYYAVGRYARELPQEPVAATLLCSFCDSTFSCDRRRCPNCGEPAPDVRV